MRTFTMFLVKLFTVFSEVFLLLNVPTISSMLPSLTKYILVFIFRVKSVCMCALVVQTHMSLHFSASNFNPKVLKSFFDPKKEHFFLLFHFEKENFEFLIDTRSISIEFKHRRPTFISLSI